MKHRASLLLLALAVAAPVGAQETPYFVTYDHHMEEPGYLELSFNPVYGVPKGGNKSVATSMELEYGTRGWWTTALYLDGQKTFRDSTLFTGYRIENRFRLLMHEHWINPVFYVEYTDVNGADKIMKEIVGFDSWRDLVASNNEARSEKEREIETKLILSHNGHGWNVAGNWIAEKNLAGSPWEFGYALGANRPLALAASPVECSFCRENFSAGVEVYGGLGESRQITVRGTSHYIAPCVAWNLPNGLTLRLSPAFGVTGNSNRSIVRFGISYEMPVFR